MDYVLDFVGYKVATDEEWHLNFIIKEFCIIRVNGNNVFKPVHHIMKRPFLWQQLPDYFKNQYTESIRNIHGLDWVDGDVSMKKARKIISHKFKKARSIYVLKEAQIRDFKRFTRASYPMTSLERLGFKLPESILTLKTWSKNSMSHHVVKTAMFTANLLSRQNLPLTIGSLRRNMQKMHLTDNEIKKINKQIRRFLKKSLSITTIELKIINQLDGRVRVEMKNYVNSKFRNKNWLEMDKYDYYPDMHFRIVTSKFSKPKAYLVSVDVTGEKLELVDDDQFHQLWEILKLLDQQIDHEREKLKKIDNDDNDLAAIGSNHWMGPEELDEADVSWTCRTIRAKPKEDQLKGISSRRDSPDVDSSIEISDNESVGDGTLHTEDNVEESYDNLANQVLQSSNNLENNQVNSNAIIVDSDSDVDRVYEHKKLLRALSRSQNLQSDSNGHDIHSRPRLDLDKASGSQRSVNRRNSLVKLDHFEVIGSSSENDDSDAKSDIIKLNVGFRKSDVESDLIHLIRDDDSSEDDVMIIDDNSPRLINNTFDDED